MPMELPPITPKRVDETWKEQVEREKSAPNTQPPAQTQGGKPPHAAATAAAPAAAAGPATDQRFETLISSLAMEAFIHLGDAPHPSTNRPEPNLAQAKYVIDLLGMLEQKTTGNLSPEESRQLGEYLYQLRMRFVEKTQPPIPPPPGAKGPAR